MTRLMLLLWQRGPLDSRMSSQSQPPPSRWPKPKVPQSWGVWKKEGRQFAGHPPQSTDTVEHPRPVEEIHGGKKASGRGRPLN